MTKLTQKYLDQRAAELYPAELCTDLEVWIELGITNTPVKTLAGSLLP
jgi:hypothetical protein